MRAIFYECSSLKSLPDISKWNTNNITDMSFIFALCSSLSSLPDISKWNTINVTNISAIFGNCSSLKSLPDISKWNIKNLIDINNIFKGCSSLLSFPDISKWNFHNIIDKNKIIPIENTSSFNYSSKEDNVNNIDSYNINSSNFLNNIEKSDFNYGYTVEDVTFFQEDNSLTLFYDNFYQDL